MGNNLITLLQYFETDDPELYKSKIKFIEDNSIEDMELNFTEEEYVDGQLVKVIQNYEIIHSILFIYTLYNVEKYLFFCEQIHEMWQYWQEYFTQSTLLK